jgi:glucokinase
LSAMTSKRLRSPRRRRGALAGVDPGLYLNLGTGIAAAIVVNGRVVQGAHGASGEIGYGTVGAGSELDWSGQGAPLEQHVGGRGLSERGSQRFGTDGTARSLLELARTDAEATAFLRERVDELARRILTCALPSTRGASWSEAA